MYLHAAETTIKQCAESCSCWSAEYDGENLTKTTPHSPDANRSLKSTTSHVVVKKTTENVCNTYEDFEKLSTTKSPASSTLCGEPLVGSALSDNQPASQQSSAPVDSDLKSSDSAFELHSNFNQFLYTLKDVQVSHILLIITFVFSIYI